MSSRKKPTEKLAERAMPLASDEAHEQLYDLLVGAASDRVVPVVAEDSPDHREEAA